MITSLTGNADSKILSRWSTTYPYSTGVKVECSTVYSVAYGTVIFVGYAGNTYVVTVQCNSDECIRYSNLMSSAVTLNQILNIGDTVGQAKGSVLFEYCTTWRGNSSWTVRTSSKTYYKQNPADILSGAYTIESYHEITEVTRNNVPYITLTQAQKAEFADNRGSDKDVEF